MFSILLACVKYAIIVLKSANSAIEKCHIMFKKGYLEYIAIFLCNAKLYPKKNLNTLYIN